MTRWAVLVLAATVASCGGGYDSSSVVVGPSVGTITVGVTPENATLQVGESVRLTATVAGGPTSASREVTFSTSNDAIVVVEALANAMGKVTAVGKGNAVVTATSVANPQKSASSVIAVAP